MWMLIDNNYTLTIAESPYKSRKALFDFQLLLVKLFSQTYYYSDTKFWPDKYLLCHTSVNPCPPPSPPIYISRIFPKVYQGMPFIQLIYSRFSQYHVSTNGVAPFSAYKHTHNPQFLYSLRRRAGAPNASFETLNSGQFMLSTQLIIPNYLDILSHWCSTTVTLETYPH